MSGEVPVVVLAGPDGTFDRLITTLVEVVASLGRPCALIGGLAVAARLTRAERVTGDVDTVVDAPEDPPSADLLLARGVADERVGGSSSVMVYGVKVDLIDTFSMPPEFVSEVSTANDHFALAHRYAFESATPLRLEATSGAHVTMAVAAPAALLAMKLHAARWRHNRVKVAGDLFDMYRLLDTYDRKGEVAASIAAEPGLGVLCLEAARHLFVDRLTASAGALSAGGGVLSSVTRDRLADLTDPFVRRLGHLIQRP